MSRLYSVALALLLVVSSYVSTAFSQDAVETGTNSAQQSTRELEEITVVGQRSLLSMRYQIRREEDNLYKLFNELNSTDEFDIKCRNVTRNSYIPRRECEPKFFTKARQANAIMGLVDMRDSLSSDAAGVNETLMERGIDLLESDAELAQQEGKTFEALNEEIFRIAMENPDYLKALLRIDEMKKQYAAKRQQKFGK
jgi:hypothetical protein